MKTNNTAPIPAHRVAIAALFACVLAYALATPHSPLAPVAVTLGIVAGDLS